MNMNNYTKGVELAQVWKMRRKTKKQDITNNEKVKKWLNSNNNNMNL